MRTNYSIKNSISTFVSNIILLIVTIISQRVFISILGIEYLGLNGLFSNVLTLLSLFELGIGSAIIYHLYKPVAKNDHETIKSLMLFYKKSYLIIALTIFIVGLLIIPIIPLIASTSLPINIYIVYILFLLSTVVSYLMAYKRSLIIADQKTYINNIVHIGYLLILNISQLLILFITKNYYLYLIIKIVCILLENIVISLIANKMYPYLLDKDIKKLPEKIRKDIISKVKALLIHKTSGVIKYGTDSIFISIFFGLRMVGIYTNYYYILYSVNTIFTGIISSVSASVGNLLTEKNLNRKYLIFKKIKFLNFYIAVFTSTCILVLTEDFIKIWVGKEYLLTFFTLVILVINFYQTMMRTSYLMFKEAAGIWIEDRLIPILEASLNIICSLILLKYFGIVGIFIGTIISGIPVWFYSYPKYVYKKLFNKNIKTYFKDIIIEIISFTFVIITTYLITNIFSSNSLYIELFIRGILSIIITNLLFVSLFFKSDSFKYYINMVFKKKV